MTAHEENPDNGKADDDGCLHASGCSRQLGLECIYEILDIDFLALVIETHDAEACGSIGEADDKTERADEQSPVEACDDDKQEQDDEHCGAVQECSAVLGGIFVRVADGAKYGTCHHHEQQREPEECHTGSAEILDARQDVVPELEQRGMIAHAVAEGNDGAESPETGPAAFSREEQAEEAEEREERASVVVVELEAVVAPVERAALAAGFGHLAVFVHGHIDEGTSLEVAVLFVLFIDIHADESRNEHLGHFFLVE